MATLVRMTFDEIVQTPVDEAVINKMNEMSDEDIDYSDRPPLTAEDWQAFMTPAQFEAYRKQQRITS